MNDSLPKCRICRQPLHGPTREAGVCTKAACHRADAAPGRRCAVCGVTLPIHDRHSEVCTSLDCRRELLWRQGRKTVHRQRADMLKHVGELRDASTEVVEPTRYSLVVIPSYRVSITTLPDQRREDFANVLRDFICRARANPTTPENGECDAPEPTLPPALPAEVLPILGAACSLCQGFCCRTGTDHAHLRVDTLRRYFVAHPDRTDDEIVADYLSHIGQETYQGSCVFHSRAGCTLPKGLRSHVCDEYLCPGLLDYLNDRPTDEPAQAFIACTSCSLIVETRFVSAST